MSYENDTEKYWPKGRVDSKWFSRTYFEREYPISEWRRRTWRILWRRAHDAPEPIQKRWRIAYERFQARKKPNYRNMYGGHWRANIHLTRFSKKLDK